jgi:acetylornithine deacetylase/succinyl-diaminopimelate desuccinylase-like protein
LAHYHHLHHHYHYHYHYHYHHYPSLTPKSPPLSSPLFGEIQAGTGPYVLESSKGGCTPDASCIASYLLTAVEFSYLGCLSDEPQFSK